MGWQRASGSDLPGIKQFLRHEEWRWTTLSSRIKTGGRGLLESSKGTVLLRKEAECISDLLYIGPGNIILPAFSHPSSFPETIFPILDCIPNSILGCASSVIALESLFPQKPSARIEYLLMRKMFACHWTSIPRGLKVQKASSGDIAGLYPLQRAYELEEVLVNPGKFNQTVCLFNLKLSLREQFILLGKIDGRIVAKAGTNARGFHYDQIGGVFTNPEYRGRGIATSLMAALCNKLEAEGREICLFVKPGNTPALQSYHNLGFRVVEDFRINYYQ
ncbi:MAG: GNAT family N-acetyltransferase [Spirochaetales bacterium]|nr:GNAT family N-acetyltransferase [Spirochaetales bacterium]